jgi:hypothetical protein
MKMLVVLVVPAVGVAVAVAVTVAGGIGVAVAVEGDGGQRDADENRKNSLKNVPNTMHSAVRGPANSCMRDVTDLTDFWAVGDEQTPAVEG